MSANLITATKLWYDGELAIGACPASFNCNTFTGTTPRAAWLTPIPGCVGSTAYALNLAMPVPLPAGTLEGVWLEFINGTGMMVDAVSVQAVMTACNACCGATTIVAPRYSGVFPVPAPLEFSVYTFTREDQGDWYAYNSASLAYWPQWIPGTFNKISHDDETGITTYTMACYFPPIYINGDTEVSHTSRVFTSNTVPTAGGGQTLVMTVIADGTTLFPPLTGANAAALVSAATASSVYNTKGTYATSTGKITLTSQTVVTGQITVQAKDIVLYVSNDPGAPGVGQTVSLSVTIDGTGITPQIGAANVTALATALNGSAVYDKYGTWAAAGTTITLSSATVLSASLVLSLV
jgi:hypothetical protein